MVQATNKNTLLSRQSATALVALAAIAAGAAAAVKPAQARLPIGEYSHPELASRFDLIYDRWRVAQSWDDATMFPVIRDIICTPARTLLDLTLKARAIAVCEYDIWTEGEGEVRDIGAVAVRSLVDDLCWLAGIELLPGVELVPFVTIDDCVAR